ncbi:dephospho-CoA kinase [bacterium]|nr:dephospho-CoA kinase [bacterium]
MKKIGVTGGIGSGKSYVTKVFEKLDISIFNADIEAKKLMRNSNELKNLIITHFGDDIYKNGLLNSKLLSSIVFSNKVKLQKLNSLVHPMVKEEFKIWCINQQSKYIIKEAAILFESNSHQELDAVICVSAPIEMRIRRILNRDHLSENDIKKRIDNQISQEEKEKLSNYIIVNDESNLLLPQIINLHEKLVSLSS